MKHLYLRVSVIFFALLLIAIEGKALTVTITSQINPSCFNVCNGSITCVASGGVAPYTYAWTNTTQTTATINNLCAGTYTVTVTDAAMTTATASATMTQPTALTVSVVSVNNALCNQCNGSATVSASGGTPAYTYSWAPSGGTAATATNLCPGSYTVVITDTNGCTAFTSVTIASTGTMSLAFTNVSNVFCNGGCNGAVTGVPSGGSPPYFYSWSPSGGNQSTASGLCAGTYTLTVTDANGCSATSALMITQPPALTANAGPDQNICFGGSATLSGTSSGGSGSYTYLWSGPSSVFATTMMLTVSPTVTSTYTFNVTDGNGCTTTDIVIVTPTQQLNLAFSSYDATCNQANGGISVLPSGGLAPYTYLWANSVTNDTNINLAAGVHSVTVTDANGCTNTSSGSINNSAGPVIAVSNSVNPNCYNGANGSATVNVTGSPQAYAYLWNSAPPQTTATATNLPAGIYFCTVTDTGGCQSSVSATIVQPPQLYLGAQIISSSNCINNGSAWAWASGGAAPYNFAWPNSITGDTATGLAAGIVPVTVTDNTGCSLSGSVTIPSSYATLVTGKVYSDANGNCIFDAGDAPIANQMVSISPFNNYCLTDSSGNYQFFPTATGPQTIYVTYNYTSPYTTGFCPVSNSTAINISALCDTISNIDFTRVQVPGMQDLRVSMSIQHANPRAGFPETVFIHYDNVGTVTVPNTSVSLVYDSIMSFISSPQTPSVNNQAYIEWNTGTLLPGQSGNLSVVLQCPTIQNGGYIGRPLNFNATINPIAGDQTPVDNGEDEMHHIVASWDPNEKSCYATGMDSLGNITPGDSLLSYTIHFQNTGTDTAYNVYVEDTLSQYLNPATITPGISSHPYTLEISGNGLLRFNFYNIMLPDSNHNEPLSNGFVKYTVKTFPGLPLGTTIDNTAFIYFDFNPAVVTNTTSNTIMLPAPLSIPENNFGEISAYPNPFDESVTLIVPENFKGKNCEVTLTDIEGRVVLTQQKQNANSIIIQRGQLEAGIYFCTIRCEGQLVGNKKLIIK